VLGASVLGSILTSHFADNLTHHLHQDGLPSEVVDQVVGAAERGNSAASLPPGLADQVTNAVHTAFTAAYHSGMLVGGMALLAMAVPTVILVRHKPAE
jgi:DHA2 family multidrug resistance protein-like MFS transporter